MRRRQLKSPGPKAIWEIGGVKISKNSLFHKSKENIGNIVRINLFRTLEINQRLAAIQGMFKKNLVRRASIVAF